VGEWCTTGNPDNKRLLLVDDGDEDRLVIFATDEGLQNLSNYDIYILFIKNRRFMQSYKIN